MVADLTEGGSREAAQPARRHSFFVGGTYSGAPGAAVMHGQMYVEVLTPARVTRPFPLVLIHGAAQTAACWLTTPDGRPGWAEWFAGAGWQVCIVDQPARGRSAWQPGIDGPVKPVPAELIERLFTAPEYHGEWPQARLHTQWPGGPGKGRMGDPVFDQFYAAGVPSLDNPASERLMQAAGAALLDRIGPAVVLTHSQAGLFGWLIADLRPGLVKAIVALEPAGPPYRDAIFRSGSERPFGLTTQPLLYDPPVRPGSPLAFEQQAVPDAPDLIPCWSQKGEPRRLRNLAGIPILVATGEASYHAMYDHCTACYLRRAGADVEHVRLAERGMRGNGHMMMLEMNNLEIAAFIDGWLQQRLAPPPE
jgi:pimeloyl-ACP methyl ester carboxylesterase